MPSSLPSIVGMFKVRDSIVILLNIFGNKCHNHVQRWKAVPTRKPWDEWWWVENAEPIAIPIILELFTIGSDSDATISVCVKHIMFYHTEHTVHPSHFLKTTHVVGGKSHQTYWVELSLLRGDRRAHFLSFHFSYLLPVSPRELDHGRVSENILFCEREEHELWNLTAWVPILAAPYTICMTLAGSFECSMPLFPHL